MFTIIGLMLTGMLLGYLLRKEVYIRFILSSRYYLGAAVHPRH